MKKALNSSIIISGFKKSYPRIVFFLLLFVSQLSFGQSFAPFNENNPKRFADQMNLSDNAYYFYPIETELNGDTISFRQYLRLSGAFVNVMGTSCEGWGGGSEQPTVDTTWLGRKIYYKTNTKELVISNSENEPLTFNFNLNLGDSSLFYSMGTEEYYIRYDFLNQELVIDSLEFVKTFTIWKYDNTGTLLTSTLNGFEIKLSENLGLASFINCNDFPVVEQGVQLVGQLNPTIGYYQLTYDEVFPWVPGDTLELRGWSTYSSVQTSTWSHKLITILNRVETSDSVWIFLNEEVQINQYPSGAPTSAYPAPFNINYPNPIVFQKGENISSEPNNMRSTFFSELFLNDSIDMCGMRNRFRSQGYFETYCDSCDCFTPLDGFGSVIQTHEYLEGLGLTVLQIQPYGFFSDVSYTELIYSNVGGVQCGTYAALGINELEYSQDKHLLKIVDLIGRATDFKPNTLLIYVYSDGSVEKIFKGE